jgi:hypothetical protein
VVNTEEGGDDVKSAWPFDALGDTRATMARTASLSKPVRGSESLKPSLSPDWSLQLDSMKLESLVTADQPRRGEYVLGLCTQVSKGARQCIYPRG